jgi:hypothetical protein
MRNACCVTFIARSTHQGKLRQDECDASMPIKLDLLPAFIPNALSVIGRKFASTARWLLAICLLSSAIVHAQSVTLPINQTLLPDGQIRYSIPVKISDEKPIEAMLDTGSVGLRVLVNAFPDGIEQAILDSKKASDYSYSSGEIIAGIDTHAQIDIGRRGDIPFQLVTEVNCLPDKPHCAASKVPAAHYRIGGNGYSQLGFSAIIGVGPVRQDGTGLSNPFTALGYRQWTIELPLPDDKAPGRLTLYAAATPMPDFTPLMSSSGGYVPGCLIADVNQHVCAPILLDTGAYGVSIYLGDVTSASSWRPGSRARVSFSGSEVPPILFNAGYRGTYTGITKFPADHHPPPMINGGVLPFLHYVILYNAQGRPIGARAREAANQ